MTHLPSNLPMVIQNAAPFVRSYGYEGMVGLLLLESAGLPIPGETFLIVAAIFAGIGQLNIFLVILTGILAVVCGSSIAYGIGVLLGERIIKKYGKYVFLPTERFDKLERFYSQNGAKVVIVSRFVAVLRQLNGYVAGISEMSWQKFSVYNFIGTLLWVVAWSSVGYFAGNHIELFLKYDLYFSVLAVLLIVGFIIWKVVSKKTKATGKEK